ncbi:protein phosphatase 1 regulatory subunit 7-like [Gigantopelta aegis]|uniref:protein phosphatase 1 regulatory subunit 7-like n=1 Tax=Gigantopelta aegis TaxID=1735272 RepID=UPI001B888BA1|nr:protein phosphatase 1 regulatory subunit 7-like [Gigantopelta aegis]
MNAKLKARVAGTLPNGIGLPVGIVPVGSRPRLVRKRTPSAGASRTSSIASTPSRVSLSSPKRKSRSPSTNSVTSDDDCPENDVRFINIPSPKSESKQGGLNQKQKQRKSINPQEVLQQCQESDYNKVYEVVLHAEDLTEVGNLEKFRKLKILDLSCNHLKKIDGLESCPDLRELKLYGNEIEAIENLNTLKDLCSLHLQHNKIKKIGRGLSGLKKLKQLRLDSNQLVKLETSDLVACVQLTTINLSSNFIDNLKALSYLPNLVELFASGNRLRKVSDLQRCKQLQEVDLSKNHITDLTGLNNLSNLQILDISCNQLTCLKSLGKLKSLEDINVSNNKLSELSDIPDIFPKLEILNLSDNAVTDWDEICVLSSCPDLVEISLAGNPVTLESGEMPNYHFEIQIDLPEIEVVDGAVVKRPSAKSSVPLMRPMSASNIVSTRQMDVQIKAFDEQFKSMENSISSRFQSLKETFDTLPTEAPAPSDRSRPTSSTDLLSSRCSNRARIMAAKSFAVENFET